MDGETYEPTCCNLPDENCTDLWLADAAVMLMSILVIFMVIHILVRF